MRSRHVETFNHDEDAAQYDADVRNERDPLRTGYASLLDWVAAQANAGSHDHVLELGAGTGNLSLQLAAHSQLVCVDVSVEMTRIGRSKLRPSANVQWVLADLLEYFDTPRGPFGAVVSTYAVHHLTGSEKHMLFHAIRGALRADGVAVFGDLMFENARERARILDGYRREGRDELAHEIESEFFWDLESDTQALRELGFRLRVKRFSELSWGVLAALAPHQAPRHT